VKPAPFRYVRADTIDEAVDTLAAEGEDAKVLAGGQSLVPALNMRLARPSVLVDVNRVAELGGVTTVNGSLAMGATVRQADARLLAHPLLVEALPYVGHVVTRNRGTVCGSVAHADPAAELPLCLVLLNGTVRARGAGGTREIRASDFFVSHFTTALEPGELVVETLWPLPGNGAGTGFCEVAQRRGDYALCMAGALVRADELRVVVGSVVDRPTLLEVDAEHPGESAAAQVEPWATAHASAAYLRHLVRVVVERAVAQARERASA
jgi:CO/xanthine dehydrogenase FAD-binding subunit